MTVSEGLPRSAPAALRNREAILAVLRDGLPPSGLVLELASGTGEHIVHFARHLPHLTWQPSDPSPEARQSIAAWIAHEGLANIKSPADLDVERSPWSIPQADAIVCINMIHISPWDATVGLMQGAASILPSGGLLYLYGPYKRAGQAIEPSNEAFDRDLRARNPHWGLRDLDDVIACAAQHALALETVIEMPANNLSVAFRKH